MDYERFNAVGSNSTCFDDGDARWNHPSTLSISSPSKQKKMIVTPLMKAYIHERDYFYLSSRVSVTDRLAKHFVMFKLQAIKGEPTKKHGLLFFYFDLRTDDSFFFTDYLFRRMHRGKVALDDSFRSFTD